MMELFAESQLTAKSIQKAETSSTATGGVLLNKAVLKNVLHYSQENICVGVSF